MTRTMTKMTKSTVEAGRRAAGRREEEQQGVSRGDEQQQQQRCARAPVLDLGDRQHPKEVGLEHVQRLVQPLVQLGRLGHPPSKASQPRQAKVCVRVCNLLFRVLSLPPAVALSLQESLGRASLAAGPVKPASAGPVAAAAGPQPLGLAAGGSTSYYSTSNEGDVARGIRSD